MNFAKGTGRSRFGLSLIMMSEWLTLSVSSAPGAWPVRRTAVSTPGIPLTQFSILRLKRRDSGKETPGGSVVLIRTDPSSRAGRKATSMRRKASATRTRGTREAASTARGLRRAKARGHA